ncbi:sodium/proton antiporter [Alcanivorax hongdengensis A-11-3]|uniref:Na(+)/H(+) antiporter NhaB n=1 Tax=Alcanivorax hongdengensis A-11-3 TaxID=1177179 RepID=L0WDX5_9GAMM|nr:sodium/proton antiporter NhaB [Alcanivorax hongdengensis]EKF74904.1 sodium/proton antiporter [Alcanivorax hongdengensis A-11-3]
MSAPQGRAFIHNFLGQAPAWYKITIVLFLLANPLLMWTMGPALTGWILLGEFIFTLAMALKCYPLQPGGLLAIEAVAIGLTSPASVLHKMEANFEVMLLLIFMVAGIFFLKDLLLYVFTRLLLGVRSKLLLSLLFSLAAALLSAFLDALTVTAVVITVCTGFYGIYHKVASGKSFQQSHDHGDDTAVEPLHKEDLERFRAFLRSLLMHAAVGTALGGVCTLVGEPQNLLIATKADWHFVEFFLRMAPITLPVLVTGLLTCVVLEWQGWFGYGQPLPRKVRAIMRRYASAQDRKRTDQNRAALIVQGLTAAWLVIGLATHAAAVGLIGLSVIILATAFTGIIEEHRLGSAFEEALPFTALLTVFFAVVAVISDQQLFVPVIEYVLHLDHNIQGPAFYLANGVLSAVSDNVFVATVYIDEVGHALLKGEISRDTFDMLAITINAGTNIPSVATPNGQAAFLFLLTSALAPLVRLSYGRMVLMALPYTLVMSVTGLLMTMTVLEPATEHMYRQGWIAHHEVAEYHPVGGSSGDH